MLLGAPGLTLMLMANLGKMTGTSTDGNVENYDEVKLLRCLPGQRNGALEWRKHFS